MSSIVVSQKFIKHDRHGRAMPITRIQRHQKNKYSTTVHQLLEKIEERENQAIERKLDEDIQACQLQAAH